MEQKQAKLGLSALLIIGIVYAILGGVFVVLGIVLATALEEESRLTGRIFLCIGSLFLVLGLVFLILEISKKRRMNRILTSGRYIWADVVDIAANHSVRINGRCVYNVMARYIDLHGVNHIFKSRNLRIFRDQGLIGKKVRVYIEDDSFKRYYMDVDEILPTIAEH